MNFKNRVIITLHIVVFSCYGAQENRMLKRSYSESDLTTYVPRPCSKEASFSPDSPLFTDSESDSNTPNINLLDIPLAQSTNTSPVSFTSIIVGALSIQDLQSHTQQTSELIKKLKQNRDNPHHSTNPSKATVEATAALQNLLTNLKKSYKECTQTLKTISHPEVSAKYNTRGRAGFRKSYDSCSSNETHDAVILHDISEEN